MNAAFSEHMAARVLELQAALRAERRRALKLELSRDMWRTRALNRTRFQRA